MKKILIIIISISTMFGCSDSKQSESVNSANKKIQMEYDKEKELAANNNDMINRLQFST